MSKKIAYFFISIIILLVLILLNSIVLLNSTLIFKVYMLFSNIPSKLSIPLDSIMTDYKAIIHYVQNPLYHNLTFNNFTLSTLGKFHFWEVKNIFLSIYIMLFISLILFSILLIKKRAFLKSSLKYLNFTVPSLFIILTICLIGDFGYVFTLFHELLFDNNYWIFDPIKDSIITVLPEGFFMLNALIILILLVFETIYFNFIVN